jgi:hypothetical protein
MAPHSFIPYSIPNTPTPPYLKPFNDYHKPIPQKSPTAFEITYALAQPRPTTKRVIAITNVNQRALLCTQLVKDLNAASSALTKPQFPNQSHALIKAVLLRPLEYIEMEPPRKPHPKAPTYPIGHSLYKPPPDPFRALLYKTRQNVLDGNYAKGLTTLTSTNISTPTMPDIPTIQKALDLFPSAKSPVPLSALPTPQEMALAPRFDKKQVLVSLTSSARGLSPGVSGSTFELWLSLVRQDDNVLVALVKFINAIIGTRESPSLDFIAACLHLIPKYKDDKPDGYRPLCLQETLCNLISDLHLRHFKADLAKGFSPGQFAFKKDGCAYLNVITKLLSIPDEEGPKQVFQSDCSNAFNTACRNVCLERVRKSFPGLYVWFHYRYSKASPLFYRSVYFCLVEECVAQGESMSSVGFCATMDLATSSQSDPTLSYCDDTIIVTHTTRLDGAKDNLTEGLHKVGLQQRESKCFTSDPNDRDAPAHLRLGQWIGGHDNVADKVAKDVRQFKSSLATIKRASKLDPTVAYALFVNSWMAQVHSYTTRNEINDAQLDEINDESLDFIRSILHLPNAIDWPILMRTYKNGGLSLRPFSNRRDEIEEKIAKAVCPGYLQTHTMPAKEALLAYRKMVGCPEDHVMPIGKENYEPAPPTESPLGKFCSAIHCFDTLPPYEILVSQVHIQLGLMILPKPYGPHVHTHNRPIINTIQRFSLRDGVLIATTLNINSLYLSLHNAVPTYILQAAALSINASVASAALANHVQLHPEFKGFHKPFNGSSMPPPPGFENQVPTPPPNHPNPQPPKAHNHPPLREINNPPKLADTTNVDNPPIPPKPGDPSALELEPNPNFEALTSMESPNVKDHTEDPASYDEALLLPKTPNTKINNIDNNSSSNTTQKSDDEDDSSDDTPGTQPPASIFIIDDLAEKSREDSRTNSRANREKSQERTEEGCERRRKIPDPLKRKKERENGENDNERDNGENDKERENGENDREK